MTIHGNSSRGLRIATVIISYIRFNAAGVRAVGTATRQGAGRSGVRIPVGPKYFFSTEIIQTGSGAQPASYSVGIRFVHLVNSEVHEVNHLPSSSVKVKNEWSYTSTPPIRLHSVDRESFTSYIRVNRMARRMKIYGSTLQRKLKNLEEKVMMVDPRVFLLRF